MKAYNKSEIMTSVHAVTNRYIGLTLNIYENENKRFKRDYDNGSPVH